MENKTKAKVSKKYEEYERKITSSIIVQIDWNKF